MHDCPDCGLSHDEPVVIAPEPEAAVEQTTEADVRIAEIAADRDIRIAKIGAGVEETALESRLGALEGKLEGMREVLDRLAPPEPETPAPVIVAPSETIAEPEPEMPSRAEKDAEPRKAPGKKGFF